MIKHSIFYLKKTINRSYPYLIQEVYVNSNFQCKNCTSCRKDTKYYDCVWFARSLAISATPTNYHSDKPYSLILSSADLFPLFYPAYKAAKLSPDLHIPTNIPNCNFNIFFADSYKPKFTSKVIIGWVAVSAVVAVIDFAGTVAFGVDYNSLQVTEREYTRYYIDWATSWKKPKNRVRLIKRRIFYSPLYWEQLWEQGSF